VSRILLGVTGGIAAYKSLEFVRLADAAGHSVRVLQTPTSRRFVGSDSFAALTGAPVLVSEFDEDPARGAFPGQPLPTHRPLHHLELVGNAELYLIAPASANTVAKLVHGIADNVVTTAALACQCPVVVAPAMNNHMYEHPATQANLALLAQRGVSVVGPDSGRLASHGEHGVGRLAEPAAILAACEQLLGAGSRAGAGAGAWDGLRVLVSAGGTREPIDAVRFIGNRSSGRMGWAMAEAARARGAQVTLVAANVALPAPPGVDVVTVGSAAELAKACTERFADCHVLLMAAAVADFRPSEAVAGKLKKAGRDSIELTLTATEDVLATLAAQRTNGQTLVGFAAEHGDQLVGYAREKLERKRLDVVVANDISAEDSGFDAEANEVVILTADGQTRLARAPKRDIADGILDVVERLRSEAVATVEGDGRGSVPKRLRALPTRL
jgi:phosphopantothenoylcysteine decarboxylase/phosphopantothenate--cysteine ligase